MLGLSKKSGMPNHTNELISFKRDLKLLELKLSRQIKILNDLLRGEDGSKKMLTTKEFQEIIKRPGESPSQTQSRMYRILREHRYITSRVKKLGIMINYKEFLKIKRYN